MIDKRQTRLTELRSELYDIANSYAGEETGAIAAELHESCNCILRSLEMAKRGVTPADNQKMLNKWLANQQAELLEMMRQR